MSIIITYFNLTRIADRVYTLLSDKDLVIIKKIGPDTYTDSGVQNESTYTSLEALVFNQIIIKGSIEQNI
ncbi:MAG: hypothetical protein WCF23_23300 [Candidatus Nitrosopolaris sp.]